MYDNREHKNPGFHLSQIFYFVHKIKDLMIGKVFPLTSKRYNKVINNIKV